MPRLPHAAVRCLALIACCAASFAALCCPLLQYFAHLRIIPVVAAITEPSPGATLIELDAVALSFPHRWGTNNCATLSLGRHLLHL